jgi:hypothetical protein
MQVTLEVYIHIYLSGGWELIYKALARFMRGRMARVDDLIFGI